MQTNIFLMYDGRMSNFVKYMLLVALMLTVVACHPRGKIERSKRQTEKESENEKGVNQIDNLRNILKTVSESIRNLIKLKEELARNLLPVIQNVGETLQDIHKSDIIQTGATLARTAANNANNLVTTVVKTGEQTVPIVTQVSNSIREISNPLIKIAICTLICPLQSDDEKIRCQKDNCLRKKDDVDSPQ